MEVSVIKWGYGFIITKTRYRVKPGMTLLIDEKTGISVLKHWKPGKKLSINRKPIATFIVQDEPSW